MRRALQIASLGRGLVSPNPMVGAVIVDSDSRIIGEGYHHKFGGPHAEVCAVKTVRDKSKLRDSTIYVTLEPCSHYGKTPPCANMLVELGIPRVVVGMTDPNPQVAGRGISILRQAGCDVTVGVLENECRALNPHFVTAHTLHRPYVLLKWAQSADGFLAQCGANDTPLSVKFSSQLTSQLVHDLRANFDAIMVGNNTINIDNPRLDTRLIAGRSPRPVVVQGHGRIKDDAAVYSHNPILIDCNARGDMAVKYVLGHLYSKGVTSLMVEGGATLLNAFLHSGLWDEARIEAAPFALGSNGYGKVDMSILDGATLMSVVKVDNRDIFTFKSKSTR